MDKDRLQLRGQAAARLRAPPFRNLQRVLLKLGGKGRNAVLIVQLVGQGNGDPSGRINAIAPTEWLDGGLALDIKPAGMNDIKSLFKKYIPAA